MEYDNTNPFEEFLGNLLEESATIQSVLEDMDLNILDDKVYKEDFYNHRSVSLSIH